LARPLLNKHDALGSQSACLAALRDALLPELLSGRVRVPEAREAIETSQSRAIPHASPYADAMATTVRVSEETRARAASLAAQRGSSIGQVVDEALEALETAEFWRKTREALARHPVELDEDPVWELSVSDGLDRE